MILFGVFIFAVIGSSLQDEFPTVDTVNGKVRGYYKKSYNGNTFSAFEGIPYAKPPIGDLRFREPQDPDSWTDVLVADGITHLCPQMSGSGIIAGTEDCLYINVYVPGNNPIPSQNLDVIVHIHGGAFGAGSASLCGPAYLIDKNIIFVTFHYRIAALGFLSTEDNVVPGNNGMKDQVKALQWIQKNIQIFGGNPNSVTTTGISAGASSVHLHYFSPLSRGLFHRGYSESGTALAPWSLQTEPREKAHKIAIQLNCRHATSEELVNCLREKTVEEILKATATLHVVDAFPLCPFGPVVEDPSETAFLVQTPHALLSNRNFNKLPWINSITTSEGLMYFLMSKSIQPMIDHWDEYLPAVLEYADSTKTEDLLTVSERIKEYYFPNGIVTGDGFVRVYGDRIFNIPFEVASRFHAQASDAPIYALQYGYYTSFKSPAINRPEGVSHVEDVDVLYDGPGIGCIKKPEVYEGTDAMIKDLYVDFLTSFAKTGVPKHNDIEWTPVSGNNDFEYLYVSKEGKIKMKYEIEVGARNFWHSLPIYYLNRTDIIKDEL